MKKHLSSSHGLISFNFLCFVGEKNLRFFKILKKRSALVHIKKAFRSSECRSSIGGGENRTLVLSELHIDDYMFRSLVLSQPCRKDQIASGQLDDLYLELPPRSSKRDRVHTKMYDGKKSRTLGPILAYRVT